MKKTGEVLDLYESPHGGNFQYLKKKRGFEIFKRAKASTFKMSMDRLILNQLWQVNFVTSFLQTQNIIRGDVITATLYEIILRESIKL